MGLFFYKLQNATNWFIKSRARSNVTQRCYTTQIKLIRGRRRLSWRYFLSERRAGLQRRSTHSHSPSPHHLPPLTQRDTSCEGKATPVVNAYINHADPYTTGSTTSKDFPFRINKTRTRFEGHRVCKNAILSNSALVKPQCFCDDPCVTLT